MYVHHLNILEGKTPPGAEAGEDTGSGDEGHAMPSIAQQNARKPGGFTGKDTRSCYKCGEVGHISRQCKSKGENTSMEMSGTKCSCCARFIPKEQYVAMKWSSSKGASKCSRCYDTSIETGSADHNGKKRFFARTDSGRGKTLTKGARAFVMSGHCKYTLQAALKMTGHAMATNGHISGKKAKARAAGEVQDGLDAPLTRRQMMDKGWAAPSTGDGGEEAEAAEDEREAEASRGRAAVLIGTESKSAAEYALEYEMEGHSLVLMAQAARRAPHRPATD